MRGKFEGAAVILGSATPSAESAYNAETGKFLLARMAAQVDNKLPPHIRIVDQRRDGPPEPGKSTFFSPMLVEAVRDRMNRGEQSILFLNRRGYARVMICEECGFEARCPDCSVTYTYSKLHEVLSCHLCGGVIPAYAALPGVRFAEDPLRRTRHREDRGGRGRRVPPGPDRPHGFRHDARRGRLRGGSRAVPARRARYPDRDPDDREGAALSKRHAGRHHQCGPRAHHAGLPGQRADVPADHAGRRPRRARRHPRRSHPSDPQSRERDRASTRRTRITTASRNSTSNSGNCSIIRRIRT